MSATQLELVIRTVGREIFTAAEAPFAASEQQRTLTVGGHNVSKQLSDASVPIIDKPPISLVIAATTTIDLTAVAGLAMPPSATRTLDMSGAKVKAIHLRAPEDNAAVVNVAPGASNGYALFGASNDIDIAPGMSVAAGFTAVESSLPAVSGTAKNITITITGSDELAVDIYLGTV